MLDEAGGRSEGVPSEVQGLQGGLGSSSGCVEPAPKVAVRLVDVVVGILPTLEVVLSLVGQLLRIGETTFKVLDLVLKLLLLALP